MNEQDYEAQVDRFDSMSQVAMEETVFKKDERLYGMCYLIPIDEAIETFKLLDYREKGGYYRTCTECTLIGEDKEMKRRVILYVGSTNVQDNTEFIGPTVNGLIDDAAIIAKACGPSGLNTEYLFQLNSVLREEFEHVDLYLIKLEEAVKSFL